MSPDPDRRVTGWKFLVWAVLAVALWTALLFWASYASGLGLGLTS